jgi:hypothetical protein
LIAKVRSTDRGKYSCIRSNEAGSISGSAFLSVLVRTQIVQPPVDSKVILGHIASLTCKVSADKNVPFQVNENNSEKIKFQLAIVVLMFFIVLHTYIPSHIIKNKKTVHMSDMQLKLILKLKNDNFYTFYESLINGARSNNSRKLTLGYKILNCNLLMFNYHRSTGTTRAKSSTRPQASASTWTRTTAR